MLKVRLAVFLLIASVLLNETVSAGTYYVDAVKGNDTNSGTSVNPWKTLSKANAVLQAGDTVYLKSGTYIETINPKNSGSASGNITYSRDPLSAKWSVKISPTQGYGAFLVNKSYIVLDGLYFYKTKSNWIKTDNASRCIFRNCRFYGAGIAYSGILVTNGSDFNRITNNVFDDSPLFPNITSLLYWDQDCQNAWNSKGDLPDKCDGLTSPADHIRIGGSSGTIQTVGNVIEGNTFGWVSHNNVNITPYIESASYTVVRGNHFSNELHTAVSANSKSLLEKNTLSGMGAKKEKNPTLRDRLKIHGAGLYAISEGTIIRSNSVSSSDFGIYIGSKNGGRNKSQNMRIYNNSLYNNTIQILMTGNSSGAYNGNIFKNNLIHRDNLIRRENLLGVLYGISANVLNFADGDYSVDNNFINNCWPTTFQNFYFKNTRTTKRTLSELIQKYSNEWNNDNFCADPKLIVGNKGELSLDKSSPLINAGKWLTYINDTSKGSTSFLRVKDATYFCDGWKIPGEKGDIIRTQSGQKTQILSIDYLNSILSVNPPISIKEGEGVALEYDGHFPDVGAMKNYMDSTLPPVNLRIFTSAYIE